MIHRLGSGDNGAGGEPVNGVTNSRGAGFCNPDSIATVGAWGWSNVPTFQTMRGPAGSGTGFDMSKDANARWCGGAVEIVGAMEVSPGREEWIDAAAAQ